MYTYEEVIDKIENSRRFGKGSTCAFLTNIFTQARLKCGCFTSPHLIHFEERITVAQQMIPKDVVTRIGNELLAMDFGVTPTMFDYCLVMAVLYFKECGCDVAVMETGLGGRLDSTNTLGNPMVAVITRIGYDHMAILGNTLTEIASEKAGILKENVPAVFAPQDEESLAVLRQHPSGNARERGRYAAGGNDATGAYRRVSVGERRSSYACRKKFLCADRI